MGAAVKIHTNLADVDDTVFRWTVDALLEGRGYEPVFGMEALKAHDDGHDDGEDFHVRALRDVYERLRAQFGIYARAVAGQVREWAGTRAMPFEQLRRALAVAAGHFMKAMGLAPGLPVPGDPAWKIDVVELPYKLSHLGLEDGDETPLSELRPRLAEVQINTVDQQAIAYLKNAAGAFLRPVVEGVADGALKATLVRDRHATMQAALYGVEKKQTPAEVARRMGKLAGHWDRDWHRVARTELAFAYNYGHLNFWLRAHPHNDGREDGDLRLPPGTLVYKQPQAVKRDEQGRVIAPCKHCHRIWYHDDETPRLYRLEDVVANGENVGRRASEWKATVGPTHPNDLCGPLIRYVPGMEKLHPGFAAQLGKLQGG